MVLGAELGRRLKKERERQRSLSRKQLSLKTLEAQCPRPDPAGRSVAPVLRLPPWWGRPRGLTGQRHCGGDQRALPGSPPAAGPCAGAPRTLSARDFGAGEQDSSGKETSGGEAAAAGLRRLPVGASTPAFPGPDREERPQAACAGGRPALPPPAAAPGSLPTRSALVPTTPNPFRSPRIGPGQPAGERGAGLGLGGEDASVPS